jgi:glutathionyl-hydroquinone reductase
LFFRVFSIIQIENKVSVKYKTKNIKTEGNEVFLATKNQRRANIISSRNFTLIATRLYRVWLSGSLFCPFKKMRIVITAIIEKADDKIKVSLKEKFSLTAGISKYAINRNRTFKNTSNKVYL